MQENTDHLILTPQPYMGKLEDGIYFVYRTPKEWKRIRAKTVSEAISKADIADPIRVHRHDPLSQVLLSGEDFHFDQQIQEENSEASTQEDTAEPTSEPAEQQEAAAESDAGETPE